ncbi:hypothetical protein [Eubacterium sp. An3]|uniref:hypothetical protein n=1 Tax=Eubacterium sp. An3 TaxID=1965628 RepID=UPI000B37FEC2|nr:hypothetical protein [Eubacterium sp. An3]OUO25393.1 hypothetical protein B5F87_17510 [Eubacterium sp. An3]
MGSFLFMEFQTIFGGGAIEDTASFMSSIIGALRNVFAENGAVTQGMALFLGIAGLIAIIGYFMELWNLSAKDFLTFDKMVLSFTKVVFVLVLLIFSQDLIVAAFNVCAAGYDYVAEEMPNITSSSDNVRITYFGQSEIPDNYTDPLPDPVDSVTQGILDSEAGNDDDRTEVSMQTIFECKKFTGGGALERTLKMLSSILTLFLPFLLCFVAQCVAYFVCVSNAIQLIAYGIFSPIALAQSYDEGSRATGIQYLKKFIAAGITFAVIIVIMSAASWLQSGIVTWIAGTSGNLLDDEGVLAINAINFYNIIGNLKLIIPYTVIQFGAIGAILKCDQVARDMLGAR